ncbi:cyclophilin-like fold protein [Neisseria sp. CCUG12390]|uniref:cyclophilin-like fold protein n=1 Tax=Neisseria sp. CCUG12390 TaxID=3392035 RepID=UPI003A100FDF
MRKLLLAAIAISGIAACHAETPRHSPEQETPMTAQTAPETRTVRLLIGGQAFEIKTENNPTAQAFARLLPLELSMQDHLQNEKFAALSTPLPADDKTAGRIRAGDVMLYQGDTLVIFYETFDSSYRYTKIGTIAEAGRLKAALGRGKITVRMEK